MGYNERNPIFSFRLGEYRHGKLLRQSKINKMPANDFLRKIIDQYMAGDLIPKAKDDLAVEMTKLKLEKTRQEIEYMKLKIKYMETFGAPMSTAATRTIKPQIVNGSDKTVWISSTNPQPKTQLSPYDAKNNLIKCVECSTEYPWQTRDDFLNQKFEFERHMTITHGRALSYLEKSVIDDLSFSGASR